METRKLAAIVVAAIALAIGLWCVVHPMTERARRTTAVESRAGGASGEDEEAAAAGSGAESRIRVKPFERQDAGAVDTEGAPDTRPLLAAGKVVDDDGRPVPNAAVLIDHTQTPAAGVDHERLSWGRIDAGGRGCLSDSAGHFEFRAEGGSGVLRIAAAAPGFWADNSAEFTCGATDLVLRLHRGGSIAGTLILREGLTSDMVWIVARLALPAGDRRWLAWGSASSAYAASDGVFMLEGLREGAFTVTVTLKNEREDVAVVSQVVVSASHETRDPRLNPLDLRSIAPPVHLTVVDSAGEALRNARARTVGPGTQVASQTHWSQRADGIVPLGLCPEPVDVEVWAPQHRSVILHAVSSDARVVLEKGIPVQLVVDNPEAIPAEPVIFEAWVTCGVDSDMNSSSPGMVDRVTRATGSVSLIVPAPGPYALHYLCSREVPGKPRVYSNLERAATIAVADSTVEQVIRVRLPAEAMAKAVEKLK